MISPPAAHNKDTAIEMGVIYQNSAEARDSSYKMTTIISKDYPVYEGPQVKRQMQMPVEDGVREYDEIQRNSQQHAVPVQPTAQDYELPQAQGYQTPVKHTARGYATTADVQRYQYQAPANREPTEYEQPVKRAK